MAVKLSVWRESLGMTQAELGATLGCSQATVSLLERGVRDAPRAKLMRRIVAVSKGLVQPADFYDQSEAA